MAPFQLLPKSTCGPTILGWSTGHADAGAAAAVVMARAAAAAASDRMMVERCMMPPVWWSGGATGNVTDVCRARRAPGAGAELRAGAAWHTPVIVERVRFPLCSV